MLEVFIQHIDKFIAISLSLALIVGVIFLIEKELPDDSLETSDPDFPSFKK